MFKEDLVRFILMHHAHTPAPSTYGRNTSHFSKFCWNVL